MCLEVGEGVRSGVEKEVEDAEVGSEGVSLGEGLVVGFGREGVFGPTAGGFGVYHVAEVLDSLMEGKVVFGEADGSAELENVHELVEYPGVEVEEVFLFPLEEGEEVVDVVVVVGGVLVGGLDALEVEFLPAGGVVDEDVPGVCFRGGAFGDGDGEGHDAVGRHDVAAVAVALLAVVLVGLDEKFVTGFDLGHVLDGGKVSGVEQYRFHVVHFTR